MSTLTYAVCSYNRAERLEKLIPVMRGQHCPVPFEILVVDNNSSDKTPEIVAKLAAKPGPSVRYVRETEQGIPYARNRAIKESLQSAYLGFYR